MKKYLFSFILSLAGLGIASADEPVSGIIATYEGAATSYKLSDVPTVKYETVEGVRHAVLYLQGIAQPVLSLPLADDKELIVTYGEYDPTAIESVAGDKVAITERNGRKLIQGGKLIIIGKDGRKYNTAGIELHQ